MTITILTAIFGMTLLMIVWGLTQSWWRKIFADEIEEEDVLALRSRCGDCGCGVICQDQNEKRTTRF